MENGILYHVCVSSQRRHVLYGKEKDLGFQKTHKSIQDTLKSLMLHKDLKDISVQILFFHS